MTKNEALNEAWKALDSLVGVKDRLSVQPIAIAIWKKMLDGADLPAIAAALIRDAWTTSESREIHGAHAGTVQAFQADLERAICQTMEPIIEDVREAVRRALKIGRTA